MQDFQLSGDLLFLSNVLDWYCSLISSADADESGERGLGGQLFYAGKLDESSRAAVRAANVGGAATLAASDDSDEQRQCIRDGVVDFAVTNLDEALRILKNEVRKRETVAVCVGAAPEAVEAEMRERGVAPDLISLGAAEWNKTAARRAKLIEPVCAEDNHAMVVWSVATSPAQWLPRLDALITETLGERAWVERRWIRRSPRFLGRAAKSVRAVRCELPAAAEIVRRLERAMLRGEIGVRVELQVIRRGIAERHHLEPSIL